MNPHFSSHRAAVGTPSRVADLFDSLKQEYDTLAHEVNVYKAQRDEFERKLQAQVSELTNIQQVLYDLERAHTKMKMQYEEEINRLRRQLEGKPPLPPSESNGVAERIPKRSRDDGVPEPDKQLPKVDPAQDKTRSDWMVGFNSAVPNTFGVNLSKTLSHDSVVCCVRFSTDGRYLATGCNKTAQIFDVKSGDKLRVFGNETEREGDLYIRSVAFSPVGGFLATGAEDKNIRLWNINDNKLVQTLEGHDLDIYSLDFSADGRFIVSGSGDKRVMVWDLEKGKALHVLGDENGPKDGVTSVAISPDGRFIAAGSLDRVVRLWDASTGALVDRFEGHADSVYSVAFCPSSKQLASGGLDRTLRLWDLAQRRSRATFQGHKDYVLSVAFSPDGQWLVSGSKDRSVQFWNPDTAISHMMLQGHKNSVISVAMSPALNSGIFATGSGDNRARIWQYGPNEPH